VSQATGYAIQLNSVLVHGQDELKGLGRKDIGCKKNQRGWG